MNYHSDFNRVSNSMLSVLKRSSSEFKARFIDRTLETKETKAMLLGSMVHCSVLEPTLLPVHFAIEPECDRRTREGQAQWAVFQASLGDNVRSVSQAEWELAENISNAVVTHADSVRLIRSCTDIEVPLSSEWCGVPVRGKPDAIGDRIIIDLKTCKDPSPSGFKCSVLNYGYHRQAAFYRHLCREVYGVSKTFLFIAVGTSEPFDVGVYQLDDAMLERGHQEAEALLREYRDRKAANDWRPMWSKGVNVLELPKWYDSEVFEFEGDDEDE